MEPNARWQNTTSTQALHDAHSECKITIVLAEDLEALSFELCIGLPELLGLLSSRYKTRDRRCAIYVGRLNCHNFRNKTGVPNYLSAICISYHRIY